MHAWPSRTGLTIVSVLAAITALFCLNASADQSSILARWYQNVGERVPGETFGSFLGRVGVARLDTPYGHASDPRGSETLSVELRHFECVSFLESSLAVARCAWRGEPTQECFVWEVMGFRYRSGLMANYASRLHYFADWLEDNGGRWRLNNVTGELGGRPVKRDFFYLTRRASKAPALASSGERRAMAAIEGDLSSRSHYVLGRNDIRAAVNELQHGDLIAIVGNKPGRLITHAGLIVRGEGDKARLLHASSYHRRVVVTREDVADYVMRRPERAGIIVARPLPPQETQ